MLGIIGKKVGMSRTYDEKGHSIACTLVHSGPCVVTQIRTQERDGYQAVQLGYETKQERHTTRPLRKHFDKAGTPPQKHLVEFPGFLQDHPADTLALGSTITLQDLFQEGEYIDVQGTSKGKGFQGTVKRHGFSGVGDKTHGQHNRERAPGSVGAGSDPSRVFKGMRMAGRTGGRKVTVTNLRILKIIPEHHLILLQGALPGARNSYVILKK